MRVLLDTNVLISALIKAGKPQHLLDALLKEHHTLLISRPILEEFSKVAADERIRHYVTSDDATTFLRIVITRGEGIQCKSRFKLLKSPDDAILRTAYDGQATLIVTGDRHLLELKHFKGIKILTVAQALEAIRFDENS